MNDKEDTEYQGNLQILYLYYALRERSAYVIYWLMSVFVLHYNSYCR